MVKVRVNVSVYVPVSYVVDVCNKDNIDEILEKLNELEPDDWEDDPDFYAVLGDEFGSWRANEVETEELYECPECHGKGERETIGEFRLSCNTCWGRGYIDEFRKSVIERKK